MTSVVIIGLGFFYFLQIVASLGLKLTLQRSTFAVQQSLLVLDATTWRWKRGTFDLLFVQGTDQKDAGMARQEYASHKNYGQLVKQDSPGHRCRWVSLFYQVYVFLQLHIGVVQTPLVSVTLLLLYHLLRL